jgi:hypothetical protein
MFKIYRLFFIFCFFTMFSAPYLYARINLLDPWHPGQDSSIGKTNSYQALGLFRAGEYFYEVPFHFSYITGTKSEVGGRWGIISVKGKTGISDLVLGAKYQFITGEGNKPAVIGEASLSLPTADHKRGLGLGAAGFNVHWALEKEIDNFMGYFGLGFGMSAENSDNIKRGNMFYYHIGASCPYKKNYRIHAEFKGYNHGDTEVSGTSLSDSYQETYLAPGLNYYWTKNKTVSAALLIGLTKESDDLGLIVSCNF